MMGEHHETAAWQACSKPSPVSSAGQPVPRSNCLNTLMWVQVARPRLPSRHHLPPPPSPSTYYQHASHLRLSRQVTATTTGLSATTTGGTGVLT
jgi:hypothetical protein